MIAAPTKPGTACVNCGKRIGRGMLRHYPYSRFCKGTCLSAYALADLQRRADVGKPLFDDMKCACCRRALTVLVDPAELRDPKAKHTWYESAAICAVCTSGTCRRGARCCARRAA